MVPDTGQEAALSLPAVRSDETSRSHGRDAVRGGAAVRRDRPAEHRKEES
jgi:hypothetical protein